MKGHDLGVMGVLIHVIGDAINNVGVIIAALVIWLAKYEGRFYADPGVSVGIALLILASAVPLGKSAITCSSLTLISGTAVRNSGSILMESVPLGVNLDDVQHDLEMVFIRHMPRSQIRRSLMNVRFPEWPLYTSCTRGL